MYNYKYKDFESIKSITNLNEIINFGYSHFHKICLHNSSNLEVIKYCVEHGADLNIKNYYENTPFHFICDNRQHKEVLEYCLENGAGLNFKNVFENTPFTWICENNKDLIKVCKPYMEEYDFIKTLKEFNLNWKEYV